MKILRIARLGEKRMILIKKCVNVFYSHYHFVASTFVFTSVNS